MLTAKSFFAGIAVGILAEIVSIFAGYDIFHIFGNPSASPMTVGFQMVLLWPALVVCLAAGYALYRREYNFALGLFLGFVAAFFVVFLLATLTLSRG